MFCVGVYETDPCRRGIMRERIVRYAMQADFDISLLYITDAASRTEVAKYADRMQIALLCMDSPEYMELGRQIYQSNPDCRICFYKSDSCDLEPVLETRPIGFYRYEKLAQPPQLPQGRGHEDREFMGKLDRIVRDVLASGGVFRYETRKNMFLLPLRNILYFQSDLKYVDIRLLEHPDQRIYGKLSDMEQALERDNLADRFVRIHKSYLVNIRHITLLDKVTHSVVLTNGEQLPISSIQYAAVQQVLNRNGKE